jgi:HEAT repeat protein
MDSLVKMGKPGLDALISSLLKNPNPRICRSASIIFGGMKGSSAVPVLIDALGIKNRFVWMNAMDSLVKIGKPATRQLVKALTGNRNPDIRYGASFALREIKDKSAVPALIKALEDKDWGVRKYAMDSLVKMRIEPLDPMIRVLLKDRDPKMRVGAAQVLGKIAVKMKVAYVFGKLDESKAVTALIKALADRKAEVRRNVILALANIKEKRVISALTKALEDSNASVRRNAILALANIKEKRVDTALMKELKDRNPKIRWEAVSALVKIKGIRSIPVLIKTMRDKSVNVRMNVLNELVKFEDKRVVPALIKALRDENLGVRRNALIALVETRDQKAVPGLIKVLEREREGVLRLSAAKALGDLKDKRAVPTLIKALNDKEIDVRMEAVESLMKYWKSDRDILPTIVKYLKQIKTISVLLNALKDKDVDKRKKAMSGLVKMGFDKKALPSRKKIQKHIFEVDNALYRIKRKPNGLWYRI